MHGRREAFSQRHPFLFDHLSATRKRRDMTMASKTETDIESLAGELSDLRSQIARVAERLSDTASHATEDASSMGRRAWATVQDEAEPYLRGIEDHPVASTAFVFGALGLFLGLLFSRRF